MKSLLHSLPLFLIGFMVLGMVIPTVIYSQDPDPRRINYYRINDPKTPNDRYLGLRFFDSILPQDLAANDTLGAIYDLRMSAIATFELGDYIASENQVIQALTFLDVLSDKSSQTEPLLGLNNQLGRIRNAQLDYAGAREAFKKALIYAPSRNDSVVILNNIGNTYLDLRAWESAASYYRQAMDLVSDDDTNWRKAMVLDNLGRTQSALDAPQALALLQKGLQIRKSLNVTDGLYASYKGLVLHYQHVNDRTTALRYADSAFAVAKQLNSPSYKIDALSLQIDLGNYERAETYKTLLDSLTLVKQLADNKYAAQKYNVEQERKSTEAQKLQTEREKKLRIGYQSTALLLVILGGTFFYYFRMRQRQKEQQQVYLTETRISKKVHDEVANEVYGVMTRLQQEAGIKKEVIDDLEGLYNKTRDISKEYNMIDYQEGFEEVLNDLLLTYQTSGVNIITKNLGKIDWEKLDSLKKTVLYRVLQELLTNMKKHSGASIVAISVQQNGKKISLDYADNGVGSELKKRGGLLNTETRIHSVGGKITFESSPKQGFKAKIDI